MFATLIGNDAKYMTVIATDLVSPNVLLGAEIVLKIAEKWLKNL
jgi:hypothetical protein